MAKKAFFLLNRLYFLLGILILLTWYTYTWSIIFEEKHNFGHNLLHIRNFSIIFILILGRIALSALGKGSQFLFDVGHIWC